MSKRTLTTSLFRQQAMDEQKDRLYGDVIITQSLSIRIITAFISVIVIFIATLLIYGSYARKESVVGYLVPDKGLVKIYAPIRGVVKKQHIQEGQEVKKDEILFTISTIQSNDRGSDKDAVLLIELEQQKILLSKKIKAEQSLHESNASSIKNKIKGTKRELKQLSHSIALEIKQLELQSVRKLKLRQLYDKGHISESLFYEAEQRHLAGEVALQKSQQQRVQLENRSFNFANQLKELPIEWQSRVSDLDKNLSELERQIIETKGRRLYSIRAPVSGRLTALQISEGQTLNSLSPLIAILPEGSLLQAELFLPTRAAGFIGVGQQVYLRYEAFPYQHYGLHKGQVRDMAQVILAPNELPIPIALNEPVYKVRVDIDKQLVTAYGKDFPLQAGMLLDAEIVLEKRTLVQWLLEPIYGLTG